MKRLSQNPVASAWETALAQYNAARATEDAYDQATWMPAYHVSEAGGACISPDVDAEMERLQDIRHQAEDAMVSVPAPDVASVVTKIEAYRRRWDGFEWTDDQWGPILADLRRLAGER